MEKVSGIVYRSCGSPGFSGSWIDIVLWLRLGSGISCPWEIWDALNIVDLWCQRIAGWWCVTGVDVVEDRISTRITDGKHEIVMLDHMFLHSHFST